MPRIAELEALRDGTPLPDDLRVSTRKLVGRSLDGVSMRAIGWLWTGWIPRGYLTIFAGETGAGKSTSLADITARESTGAPWPGEDHTSRRAPGRVLWMGSEDSAEEMTVPRLIACDADLSNIIEITGAEQDGEHSSFSLQDDLKAVENWLIFARSEGHPFTMLVIDPVTSYLSGKRLRKVDLNDAGQLRSILEPWLKLAQEFNIAIVCVTHFAKDTNRSMLHRVLGSAAFAQTCRSLCAVIQRPGCDDDPHAKALVQVKTNLPQHPGGAWKFSTEKVEVGRDERTSQPIHATRPVWEGLDSALTPQSMVGKARGPVSQYEATFAMWLHAFFANYPPAQWLPAPQVKIAALDQNAVSPSWWDKHSNEFLQKRNVGGIWECRPKTSLNESQRNG